MRGYSRRHFDRLSNGGPDTPEQVAERIAYREAASSAVADRVARFPVLNAENASEAMRYQEERIAFHLAAAREVEHG